MLFASLSQHIRTSGASKTAQRHFNCNDPSEPIFNFCSALSSQFEVSNNQMCRQASAHCRSSGRESPQSGRGHGKGRAMVSTHWPGFECLCVSSFPGTQSRVKTWWTCWGEVAQQFAGLPTAALCCTGQWWWGSPLAGRLTAGRDHTVLDALMKTSLRLVIHPG